MLGDPVKTRFVLVQNLFSMIFHIVFILIIDIQSNRQFTFTIRPPNLIETFFCLGVSVQAPPLLSSQNLLTGSNFGSPGKWVYQLSSESTDIVKSFSSVTTSDSNENTDNEPFMLPFGPKHGDTFSYQQRRNSMHWYGGNSGTSCSFPQILDEPMAVFGTTFDWLFVCLNGQIELRSFDLTSQWLKDGSHTVEYETSVRIHVFETKEQVTTAEDNLMDYLCVYAMNDGDASLNFQYLADPCPAEKQKHEVWDWKRKVGPWDWQRQFLDMNVWTDEETLEAVVEWNKKQNVSPIDFTSDDEVSLNIFGTDTKYVNLANNVFTRESTQPTDLSIINGVLNSDPMFSEFDGTWSFVATWYKTFSHEKYSSSQAPAFLHSFQMVITCGTKPPGTNQICLAIFDYQGLSTQPSLLFPGVYLPESPGELFKLLTFTTPLHVPSRV